MVVVLINSFMSGLFFISSAMYILVFNAGFALLLILSYVVGV